MKSIIPKLFFDDEDITICLECMSKNCVCNMQENQCKCGLNISSCNWPVEECPCPICLELIRKCNCTIKIKKDFENVS